MERAPEVNNEAPLTPVGLQQLLLQQFDIYLHQKVPSFLKSNDEAPVEAPVEAPALVAVADNEAVAQPQAATKSSFWKMFDQASAKAKQLAADAKKAAVESFGQTRTHSSQVKLVIEEMEDILRKEGSAVKKMTDLTILFHGLHCHIRTGTHSKDLLPLLDAVNNRLWGCTPALQLDERPIEVANSANAIPSAEIAHNDAPVNPTPYRRVQLYKRQIQNLTGARRVEQLAFIDKYQMQIMRAHDLVCNPDRAKKYVHDSTARYVCPPDGYTAAYNGIIERFGPLTWYELWQYRCTEDNSQNKTEQLKQYLQQRLDETSNEEDSFWGRIPNVFAYAQVAIEMAKPLSSMGNTYNSFLANIAQDQYTLPIEGHDNSNNVEPLSM